MSDTYFYRLTGESERRAAEFQSKQDEQRKTLHAYLKERWGFSDGEEYMTSHGRLVGIPIKGELPSFMKKHERDSKYMCPRHSTKEGKAESEEWGKRKIGTSDKELLKSLGIEEMQFTGDGMVYPHTMIINGAAYLMTAKPCAHPEAEEVTLGFIKNEVAVHNANLKGEKS